MPDPCLGPSTSILFIPRKDSLQNKEISRTQEYQDQRANWQSIELWANNLDVSFKQACTGLLVSNTNIPLPPIPSGTPTVVPYDQTLYASPPCAVNNTLVVGGVPKTSMASFEKAGVQACSCGVTFNGPVQTSVTSHIITVSLRLHIISTGTPAYDKIVAEQTLVVPVNATGFTPSPSLQVSCEGINVAADASWYADVVQDTGNTMNFAVDNRCFLAAHMIDPNHEALNNYF